MSRKAINIVFIIGSCLYFPGIAMIIWGYVVLIQNSIQNTYYGASPMSGFAGVMALLLGGIMMVSIGSIALLVARIGALMELGKAQDWVWFILMIIFGWIVLLIYLIAVPQPKPAPQYVTNPYPYVAPGQFWPGYPPQAPGTVPTPVYPWPAHQPPPERSNIPDQPQE